MAEEPSGELPSLSEKEAAPSSKATLISWAILVVIALGLLSWWWLPKRNTMPAATTEAKPAAEGRKEEAITRVELSAEALKRAGIETAEVALQSLGQVLTATGRLTPSLFSEGS